MIEGRMKVKAIKKQESVLSFNNLDTHIGLVKEQLTHSQNSNLKLNELNFLLKEIYEGKKKVKSNKGQDVKNSNVNFVNFILESHLFAKRNHKRFWKNLDQFKIENYCRKIEVVDTYDFEAKSENWSNLSLIDEESAAANEDKTENSIKTKRTGKTVLNRPGLRDKLTLKQS